MQKKALELALHTACWTAWADGILDPAERRLLQELARELDCEDRLEKLLQSPTPAPDLLRLSAHLQERSDQLDFLTILLATSLADDSVHPEEWRRVEMVALSLGWESQALEGLYQQVKAA